MEDNAVPLGTGGRRQRACEGGSCVKVLSSGLEAATGSCDSGNGELPGTWHWHALGVYFRSLWVLRGTPQSSGSETCPLLAHICWGLTIWGHLGSVASQFLPLGDTLSSGPQQLIAPTYTRPTSLRTGIQGTVGSEAWQDEKSLVTVQSLSAIEVPSAHHASQV